MAELPARFEAWLLRRGLQVTAHRSRIARRLAQLDGHPSLRDLQADPALADIGEITVYRTVRLLEEAGLVERLVLDGIARYEPAGDHHDHFQCLDCGKVVAVASPDLEALQAEVARRHGFRVSAHEHVVHVRRGCADPEQGVAR